MKPTLLDQQLADRLAGLGYCVAPIGDATVVPRLAELYESLNCDLKTGFHADMHSHNFAYRKAVLEGVRDILSDFLARFFTDHRICVCNFIVKEPESPDSEVVLHQDWTVLEPPQRYCNVYIPLCDVTPKNGCLHVLPGSHRSDRLCLVPYRPLPLDDELRREIHEHYLVPVPMSAGECLIYDGSLLHGSPPNRSPRRRTAVGMIVVPRSAPLRMNYWPPGSTTDQVQVLEVEDEFFTKYDMKQPPQGGKFLGHVDVPWRTITRDEVRSWYSCLGKGSHRAAFGEGAAGGESLAAPAAQGGSH